jgi:spore maturation protein CgeB
MKLVIFGLSVSSSWGNGHATLWRGLLRSLAARGHRTVFFERDVPYYAAHRDLTELPGGGLRLYRDWTEVLPEATAHLRDADVAMVTSYCPDALEAADEVLASRARVRAFYDLDTPVTLSELSRGNPVPYIGPNGLAGFDLVLSYTGGSALEQLRSRLGARRVVPLYGSVDPEAHFPVPARAGYRADLSYLGTFAEDRQAALAALFVEPARRLPSKRFVMGGALYPEAFPWTQNIHFVAHVPPPDHPAFYCSSRMTLNVTRGAMARMGYCPSGRLFEAASCGVPILSDYWEGLEDFFTPGEEIVTARDAGDAAAALELPRERMERIARRARERVLAEHTDAHRARQLETLLESGISAAPGS